MFLCSGVFDGNFWVVLMSYPLSFRRHVLSLMHSEGLSEKSAARRFGIGRATIRRWIVRLEPKPRPHGAYKLDMTALAEDVRLYPDAYIYERAARFGVATSTIFYALRRLNMTYKKNSASSASGRRKTAHLPAKTGALPDQKASHRLSR